ncbi:baseplate J/gp47 family protein, partial [Paenibacillus sepulcri]|nr:baseplate J/gp47 family protein [Paenibacillus sepulcri]
FGVNRKSATKAERKGLFYGSGDGSIDVPLGSRFSIDNVIMAVKDRMDAGIFRMESETAGAVGNQKFGSMLPIDYVQGLIRAELAEVLIPGEDEESDDALRQRYYEAVNEPAFGGNVADYKQKINALDGVGGTKVFPVWNGGGTVKCVVIASDWSVPSLELINEVQTIVDPAVNGGSGIGIVPIGHVVTITGANAISIDVDTTLTLANDVTIGQIRPDVEAVIAAYLQELRQDWANTTEIFVRTAQIDARILTIPGIQDVTGSLLNGTAANVILVQDEIPVRGTVTIHE